MSHIYNYKSSIIVTLKNIKYFKRIEREIRSVKITWTKYFKTVKLRKNIFGTLKFFSFFSQTSDSFL